jgi:nicotinate-nucleotide adenylyltransferase
MKIAIFGGSFNPVHRGHLEIVKQLLSHGHVDHIIVVPARQNPLKSRPPLIPDTIRWEMLNRAFVDIPQIRLSDCELSRSGPSYTCQTLIHFRALYPDDRLYLVLGEDAFATLPQWTAVGKIVRLCRILVLPRPSQRSSNRFEPYTHGYDDRVEWLNIHIPDIAASDIRRSRTEDIAKNRWLPPGVMEIWRRFRETSAKEAIIMNTDIILAIIRQTANELKAHELIQFNLETDAAVADFVIICHGTSTTHVRGIADKIWMTLKKQGVLPLGIEGLNTGRWVLMDYNIVVVHIFLEEIRYRYRLEDLLEGHPALRFQCEKSE